MLGADSLQAVVTSRRCLGAASDKGISCPNQASPFTVAQLRKLHDILRDGDEPWDRAMAGMLLFCIYGRARWSDAQHGEELVEDVDSSGELQYLEIRSAVHKTARALHLRHMFLPLSAPAHGITDDPWGAQWLQVRKQLQIDDLKRFPLMPSPDVSLEPTKRPVSTNETKQWIAYLLGVDLVGHGKLTSHSCKCTCLSYLAKRGATIEDRLALGYHSNKMRMALTYSRDAIARPLALLSHVLHEIKVGIFEPDNTRSGRLRADAVALDKVSCFADRVEPQVGQLFESNVSEPESQREDLDSDCRSWQKVSEAPNLDTDAQMDEQPDGGHVTTDSSDSSDEEPGWAPVVGHYTISVADNKKLWLNSNSKMFHLSHIEHVKVLLCGRRIGQSFKEHSGLVRFDSAKCRQCFRLMDS